MKYVVIFLLALSVGVQAKTPKHRAKAHAIHSHMLYQLLQPQMAQQADKNKTTTGIARKRVINQWTYDSTNVTVDSFSLSYGTNKGSAFDFNKMFYPYNYAYSNTPMFNFAGAFSKPQVLYDACQHWTINPYTLSYGKYETTYATYDSALCQKTFRDIFQDSVTDQNMTFKNTFNSARNITSGYWFNQVSGVADSAFKQFFTYDNANKLLQDSIYEYHLGAWHIISRTYYTYNTTNDLVKIDCYANTMDTTYPTTFPEQAEYTNTYDGSHRLLTVSTKLFDDTLLSPFARDTFGYTGTYNFHTTWREHEYDNINGYWAPYFNMVKHLNGLGLPDTVNIMAWDSLANSWIPQTHNVITYNSFNLPDTLKDNEYNFTYFPALPKYTTIFQYEDYVDNLGVLEQEASAASFKIYPNPASNSLSILSDNTANDGMLNITILNSVGNTVYKERAMMQGGITDVNISSITPGIYWMVLHDKTGKTVHQQSFIRE